VTQKGFSKFLVIAVISLFVVSCSLVTATTLVKTNSNLQLVAEPMHTLQSAEPSANPSGYSPSQIKTAYGLPATGGAGTTIAIIDADATPNIASDLATFSTQFNLPQASLVVYQMPGIIASNSSWAMETCLDVEWAHAIAPQATILLVEALSADSNDIASAIQYATNQSNVTAISMSWGIPESQLSSSSEHNLDMKLVDNYGAAFFASAGDVGAQVNWPACSLNVVAVGGTNLNLNLDGTVNSETAWSGSGGGVSAYEPRPSYQTSFGLTYSGRAVPDVSYNAGDGVAVYSSSSGGWISVGGTSAGAPQWAAIYALDRSATNTNLYNVAKYAYSTHFRDITSGSNGAYDATPGYDLVTGLGSPLTYDFSSVTVSPNSGPPGGAVSLSGVGFTNGSSVNISYLSNQSWVSIANNVPTTMQGFNFTFTAPDLLQNNLAGDNPPASDNIVFQAVDNSNGHSYTTAVPYTEWRRGLTQIGNETAAGVYGNSTNLATQVFVQNGQSMIISGQSFNPGTASLFWDNTTNLGIVPIDGNGFFNTTVQVPITAAGQHTVIIYDNDSSFCVNVTRLPQVNNDYDGLWHTSAFPIDLTPDYNVTQIYYQINNGTVETVAANGQPNIIIEGINNTLEYWSTWDVYGTGNMTLPPVALTDIELETTPPEGSIQINGGDASTSSADVTLTVTANSLSGISQMRFSNDNVWDQVSWQPYINTQTWQLADGDGVKTVYCQILDNAGLITNLTGSIVFSAPQPLFTPTSTLTATPTATPKPSSSTSPTTTQTSTPTTSSSPTPSNFVSPLSSSPTPQAPELNLQTIIILLVAATFATLLLLKRNRYDNKKVIK
jgi:hypothetical protein